MNISEEQDRNDSKSNFRLALFHSTHKNDLWDVDKKNMGENLSDKK